MSHGVGPLFLTGPNDSDSDSGGGRGSAFSSAFTSPTNGGGTTSSENIGGGSNSGTGSGLGSGLGIGGGVGVATGVNVGSLNIGYSVIEGAPVVPVLYWNPLDTDWAENTQTTVAAFTTPSASVGGRSLNPLSEVDENEFVTDEGAQYIEESGIREAAGLGPNLSWVVAPAEVASRSMTFLGNETTMRSYVGYAQSGTDTPRTLLVHLATTESGDDIAFGVSVQHRAAYTTPSSSDVDLSALVGAVSIDDLLGTEIQTPTVSGTGDVTFILEAGIAASADEAEQALGALSLS